MTNKKAVGSHFFSSSLRPCYNVISNHAAEGPHEQVNKLLGQQDFKKPPLQSISIFLNMYSLNVFKKCYFYVIHPVWCQFPPFEF